MEHSPSPWFHLTWVLFTSSASEILISPNDFVVIINNSSKPTTIYWSYIIFHSIHSFCFLRASYRSNHLVVHIFKSKKMKTLKFTKKDKRMHSQMNNSWGINQSRSRYVCWQLNRHRIVYSLQQSILLCESKTSIRNWDPYELKDDLEFYSSSFK